MNAYILNDAGTPVLEPDMMKWALWFEAANRMIDVTELPDGVTVSTVFLGSDHAFGGGEPLLFETMIFGGALDEMQCRYATRQAAIAGHAYYVGEAKMAASSL